MIRSQITEIIMTSLRERTKGENAESRCEMSADTQLYGHNSYLDSLGLVQLLLDVEERVNDRYGVSIGVMDERAMSQTRSPFRTVDSLAAYLAGLVDEQRT